MTRRTGSLALRILFAAACVAVVSAAVAAEPAVRKPYAAMGRPTEPKVELAWNRYRDYDEMSDALKRLAAAHPQRARLQSLGKSYGDREMWVMIISNFQDDADEARHKPGMWIDGGIHANEIQTPEAVLYTAWQLLEQAETNPFIAKLLDERVFYLCPMMSPDSRDAHFYEPATTHSPRTGQRPVDDDRDGLIDEDQPNDLNGDGHITMMRVRDPNGTHKRHPDHPALMIRVKPGEKGEYRLLGYEGIDDDGDGQVNEDGDGSYDPNRDFPWGWQPQYVQRGAFRYPLAVKENRLVADFLLAHPNIIGGQTFHNAGGMILRGPGAKSDAYVREDVAVYDQLAKVGEQMLPGYRYMNIANDLYEVYGGEIDWLHQMLGVYCFNNELFTGYNFFHTKSPDEWFGTAEEQHRFNKLLLFGDGLVEWEEVEHPTYGKVEVGGFKKNWIRQPPSFLLEEELHRNAAFTLFHADQLPLVKIQSIDVKPLGQGLFEVTAILENDRIVPTHSATDLQRKITPPDVVSITGHDVQVIAALTADEPFFTKPTEQKKEPAAVKLANIGGHSVAYVRWLVQGAGPYTVQVKSIKGGTDRQTTEPQ